MVTTDIINSFREKVCREVDVESAGTNRFSVHTPFMFDDGDHFVVILRRDDGRWVLTDEGHTLMHLSYADVDASKGSRAKLIDHALTVHGLRNDLGELQLEVPDEAFGDALFTFIQALTRITDVAQWTRERVKSTFWEDFRHVLEESVPDSKRVFRYNDPELDPDGNYSIDCFIEGPKRPCFVYAIANTSRCHEATISILYFERAGRKFDSIGIFEDQASVSRRAVAQLSDVVGKQFASLGARKRIAEYLRDEVLAGGNGRA